MEIPYRHTEKIKINQHTKDCTATQIDARQVVLLVLPDKPRKPHWEHLPYREIIRQRYQRSRRLRREPGLLSTDLPNDRGTRVILQTIAPGTAVFELLSTGRTLAACALESNPATLLIQLAGFDRDTTRHLLECLTAALLAAACPLPSYKKEPGKPVALKRIEIYGLEEAVDLAQVQAETAGNHLARWLSMLPSNELTPAIYRKFVAGLAGKEGWQMTFLDTQALQRKQAGAFLAVAQGSPVADAGIVHLRYRPKNRAREAQQLSLVGKGICFDTGGVNIKTAKYMNGMHEDMQGSAVALGTLLALTRLGVDYPVDCWLALAQNHVGPKAYKPNDVVRACNGTSIEIIHTDAEGRMVLADTLSLASKDKPHVMIDYATLTGACIYSLSSRYSGVFSNRPEWHDVLINAGRCSGERVWPFPLDKDFDEALKSGIADTKQCTLEGEADHILAARFLNRFVDDEINWIHIDLAASHHKGGLGHIPSDTTGFGVRYTLDLLMQQGIMEN